MNKLLKITKTWSSVIITSVILFSSPFIAHGLTVPNRALDQQGLVNIIESIALYLIAIGAVIALLFIVIGGIRYVFAAGDSEKAGKARTMLFNGVIGLVITLGALVIVRTVEALLNSFLN